MSKFGTAHPYYYTPTTPIPQISVTCLEWNAEEADDDVSDAEVGDEEVGDSVHGAVVYDDADDESIAADGDDRDGSVEDGQENQQDGGHGKRVETKGPVVKR